MQADGKERILLLPLSLALRPFKLYSYPQPSFSSHALITLRQGVRGKKKREAGQQSKCSELSFFILSLILFFHMLVGDRQLSKSDQRLLVRRFLGSRVTLPTRVTAANMWQRKQGDGEQEERGGDGRPSGREAEENRRFHGDHQIEASDVRKGR